MKMAMRVNDGFKNLGTCAEELFKRELQLCCKNQDENLALFAETVVENFGRSNYDDSEHGGEFVAMGDQAVRLLDLLPPEKEKGSDWIYNRSFPHTKARLVRFLLVAIDCAKEEECLRFASALMSPRNSKTAEEKRNVMDAMREHLKTGNFSSHDIRVKKFISILKQVPYRAENPVFREMFHYIVKHGTKEDFKTFVNFNKDDPPYE